MYRGGKKAIPVIQKLDLSTVKSEAPTQYINLVIYNLQAVNYSYILHSTQ